MEYYKVVRRTSDGKLISCMCHLLPIELVRTYAENETMTFNTPSFVIEGDIDDVITFLQEEDLDYITDVEVWRCECGDFEDPPNYLPKPSFLNSSYVDRIWVWKEVSTVINEILSIYGMYRPFPDFTALPKTIKLIERVNY